ncbi:MAG: methyltransferase domain-containing protein [Anaerolineales bacterium]|jgi:ubiquinone/menaquinone biosynthesis C-methylase UbiE|nr:methyltransferase domain-containing protein [Anaerolineales bacterium]
MKNPKQIVQQGYDKIAEKYQDWTRKVRVEEREKYTHYLLDQLPQGANVLELGCGAGKPTTQHLAARFKLTGVDISAKQIQLARKNVAGTRFILSDMSKLDFPPNNFAGVCAFYVFNHFPREELPEMLGKIVRWLQPGGLFVASFGISDEAEIFEEDWLGAPTYWSSHVPEKTRALIETAGLKIRSAELETEKEFGVAVTFLWVVAEKPGV